MEISCLPHGGSIQTDCAVIPMKRCITTSGAEHTWGVLWREQGFAGHSHQSISQENCSFSWECHMDLLTFVISEGIHLP